MRTVKTIAAISITLSVITFLALIYACRCCNNSCCDYNLIVLVLSILVTVLIGWQIYQAIGFDKKINETVRKQKNSDALLQLMSSYIHEQNGGDDLALTAAYIALNIFEEIKAIEHIKNTKKRIHLTTVIVLLKIILESGLLELMTCSSLRGRQKQMPGSFFPLLP